MENLKKFESKYVNSKLVAIFGIVFSAAATIYSYTRDIIVSYGDAESHLNIAKRVVDSITPGLAQLGGIWLPLPHMLMLPLVKFDFLWRSGLAGSLVSGVAYVISAVFVYKTIVLLSGKKWAGLFGSFIFMLNPNILYLQSTPMTELTLILFFTLSSYYLIRFITGEGRLSDLIAAAFFGFCATLSRYDGWFLVMVEALILILFYLPKTNFRVPTVLSKLRSRWNAKRWSKIEGYTILFGTLAFAGIALWLLWGKLILGDPLYFTHSQFSAKSQQSNWLSRGELPAYKHIGASFLYYLFTSLGNAGSIIFSIALVGLLLFIFYKPSREKFLIALLLNAVFIFYVATLYVGQSVIFIKPLTPDTFDWTLFNVRYGVMMIPAVAIFTAYIFSKVKVPLKALIVALVAIQLSLFATGKTQVISKEDGLTGLSKAHRPDAEEWIHDNYDSGLVLMDDYARTVSVIRSGIPMQNMIYIGNKPYWEESLSAPEKYAGWIIVQKDDAVWQRLIDDQNMQGRLYAHFQKVYTSPEILIFKRNDLAAKQ